MNEYLDNMCRMDRFTGTTYAFSNRINIYRNCERLQYLLEFSKLRWKYRCKAHQNPLSAELRQPIFWLPTFKAHCSAGSCGRKS